MTTNLTRPAIKRHLKLGLMISAALLAAPVAVDLVSTPAFANPNDEINWRGSNRPARKTYYRSEVTGSIVPLYYTDPPYDPSDSSMKLVGGKVIRSRDPNVNKQYQVLDEINFEAQQQSDEWGMIKELEGLENSLINRGAIEFGAVVTQAGTIAKEQRQYVFSALIDRAKAQARMAAIGKVMEKMRAGKKLTRDGLRFYQDMISDQQREIEIAEDTLGRLDETQAKAFAIDVFSLGTARIGSYVSQALVKRQAAKVIANQVAAKQAAVQTATEVEKRALVEVTERAVIQAERQAATTAVKVKAAQEAASTANATARQAGTRAAQAEAAVAARQAEVKAAETAVEEAARKAGSTRAASTAAKAGAESAEASLKAAEKALASAEAKLAAAATQQEIAAARRALQTAKAAVETARTEARTATAKALEASADAATARAQLAKAKAADGTARAAVETAKTEAKQSASALARARTASAAARDQVAREAARHSDEIANVAAKLAQQQAAAGQAVQSAAANVAQANARIATASSQLAAAGSDAVRARAAKLALDAAHKELQAATNALLDLQAQLATLEAQLATAQSKVSILKYIRQIFTSGSITETSLINRFWGALFDLTNVIVDNKAGSFQPAVDAFGPHLPDVMAPIGLLYRQLTGKEREEIDRAMENAPADVKALHEKIKSGVAPVDSAQNASGGVAPVTSPAATGKDAAPKSDGKDNTVPNAPTELKPDTTPDKPETGSEPKAPRKPRWIGRATGGDGAGGGETAIAMAGFEFKFATSIPAISFEISPMPVSAAVTSIAMTAPEDASSAVMTGEEVQDRLAAIQAIRGSLPPQPYGAVSQPYGFGYGFGGMDSSDEVMRDVQDRYRDVEMHRAYREQREAIAIGQQPVQDYPQPETTAGQPVEEQPVEGGDMVQPGSGPIDPPAGTMTRVNPPALVIPAGNAAAASAMPSPQVAPMAPAMPVAQAPAPAPSTGIGGTYRLQDTSSGVRSVSIMPGANGALVISGFGQPVTLQRDGDSYFGEGATLFGQGGHLLKLTPQGNGFRLDAQHPSGGQFSTVLVR